MANIQYTDKNKNIKDGVINAWRDVDANEVKNVVNGKLDKSAFFAYTASTSGATSLITGATNGISLLGKNAALGGVLTGETIIGNLNGGGFFYDKTGAHWGQNSFGSFAGNLQSQTGYSLNYSATYNSPNYFEAGTYAQTQVTGRTSYSGFYNSAYDNAQGNANGHFGLYTGNGNGNKYINLDIQSDNNPINDYFRVAGVNFSFKGIEYAADYSANFFARSLVDAGFVTGITSNLSTTAGNGLSLVGKRVVLGGTITGNTVVTGNHKLTFSVDQFAVGVNTIASGTTSYAEGLNTIAYGDNSHAEGNSTIVRGSNSHAEGFYSEANGNAAHAEGYGTLANGAYSHSEGIQTIASGTSSHAEGYLTIAGNDNAHAEGTNTKAIGQHTHSQNYFTTAIGNNSHAEGQSTIASGTSSHAEGQSTKAIGNNSHAEGQSTIAFGLASHAEGELTTASGFGSHAEGINTLAAGTTSHSGGFASDSSHLIIASGDTSFNHSHNNSSQNIGDGALADFSAILGGVNHNIASGNTGAVILGGSTIKLTGTGYTNTTAVGNLAIFNTPSAGGSDDILTWNSTTKKVGKITQPKRFVVNLTQAGTSAPTENHLFENTLGNPTYGYDTTGSFTITFPNGTFSDPSKIFLLWNNDNPYYRRSAVSALSNLITINLFDATGTPTNDVNNLYVEVRFYS